MHCHENPHVDAERTCSRSGTDRNHQRFHRFICGYLRYGYAHGFRPDVNIPGTAGNRPYYNAPGASPLDPCGDICDSAITGGGA